MASETESNTVLKLQADYFDLFDLRIAKVLGTGKSAEVVLAVSNSYEGINRAVKRFSLKKKDLEKRNISLERAKKLFYHEVKIVRDLEHPNIIGGSNGIECPGYLAIAMDYCPRGNLADHLKRMNSGLIDRFFTGLVAGVGYLHSLRIVHGDIKLQNIFIDEKHRPVLGDFGVSYQMPENKQYVKTAGATMGYFAPEVLKKVDSVDPFKCDSYAVGVVLRCLVQRCHPDYTLDYLMELRESKNIDVKFRYILLALLCTNPSMRSTMAEVQATLKEYSSERYSLELSKKRCLEDISNASFSPPNPKSARKLSSS